MTRAAVKGTLQYYCLIAPYKLRWTLPLIALVVSIGIAVWTQHELAPAPLMPVTGCPDCHLQPLVKALPAWIAWGMPAAVVVLGIGIAALIISEYEVLTDFLQDTITGYRLWFNGKPFLGRTYSEWCLLAGKVETFARVVKCVALTSAGIAIVAMIFATGFIL